jgi:hypothetical protein
MSLLKSQSLRLEVPFSTLTSVWPGVTKLSTESFVKSVHDSRLTTSTTFFSNSQKK